VSRKSMLPVGSFVAFADEDRTRVGVVVGYDMYGSKYEIGARLAGWGQWLWMPGGTWAFPREVEEISEDDALAVWDER
jgi:hypothetical protein